MNDDKPLTDAISSINAARDLISQTLSSNAAAEPVGKLNTAVIECTRANEDRRQLLDDVEDLKRINVGLVDRLNKKTHALVRTQGNVSTVIAIVAVVISISVSVYLARQSDSATRNLLRTSQRFDLLRNNLTSLSSDVLANMVMLQPAPSINPVDILDDPATTNGDAITIVHDSRLFDLSALDPNNGSGAGIMRRICVIRKTKQKDTLLIGVNTSSGTLWARSPSHSCSIIPKKPKDDEQMHEYNVSFDISAELQDVDFPLVLDLILFDGFVDRDGYDNSWAAARLISNETRIASLAIRFPPTFKGINGHLSFRSNVKVPGREVGAEDGYQSALKQDGLIWAIFERPKLGFYYYDWTWPEAAKK